MALLTGVGLGNTVPGYQSRSGVPPGHQTQLSGSARQYLRLQTALRQRQLSGATWSCRQSTALSRDFQKVYTHLGLESLGAELSPFLDMLRSPARKVQDRTQGDRNTFGHKSFSRVNNNMGTRNQFFCDISRHISNVSRHIPSVSQGWCSTGNDKSFFLVCIFW